MSSATLESLRPRRPGGMGRGALLALLVHGGLLVAIAFGVSWRSSEPAGVTAELWAAVPEAAAPAAVAPPVVVPPPVPKPAPKVEPTPPKPDLREAEIAIEKAKVEKARQEREKAEAAAAKKRAQDEADKREREKQAREAEKTERAEKAEAERLAKQREENLKRMLGQAGATGAPQASGSAQRDTGPSASYAGRIVARVKPNIVLTEAVPATLRAEVEVRAAADGAIVGRRIVKSSGHRAWDEAVLRALDRTEVLPRDTDGRVPSLLVIAFSPV